MPSDKYSETETASIPKKTSTISTLFFTLAYTELEPVQDQLEFLVLHSTKVQLWSLMNSSELIFPYLSDLLESLKIIFKDSFLCQKIVKFF